MGWCDQQCLQRVYNLLTHLEGFELWMDRAKYLLFGQMLVSQGSMPGMHELMLFLCWCVPCGTGRSGSDLFSVAVTQLRALPKFLGSVFVPVPCGRRLGPGLSFWEQLVLMSAWAEKV
jgi:hypothetical protein